MSSTSLSQKERLSQERPIAQAKTYCWTIADIAAWRGRRMKFGYFDDPAEAYAAYVKGIEELCGLSLAEICPRLIRGA